MKRQTMTIGELMKSCTNNKYILCRHENGRLYGFNCLIASYLERKENRHLTQQTRIVSFKPCSFNEYITYKIPFSI